MPTVPSTSPGPSPGAADARSPEQVLRDERRRMVRERWMHLLLLGFALSVVAHVLVMLRLWWIKLPEREQDADAPIALNLQELPPAVDIPSEDIELPDPSPMVQGPVTTEVDPVPNLSDDLASDNPSMDSFGAIEAPGVGAIVGPGGAGSGIGIGSGKGGGGTSFFGVGGRGTRFAYIVDISGSMEQENRMATAMAELKRSIAALPDFASFYVVLFAGEAYRPDFEMDGWLRANRSNVNRMKRWLDEQYPRGATFPVPAFNVVYHLPQPPDVIFFLTDGEIPGETLYHVDGYAEETGNKVIVNTIGFSSEAGKEPLVELAKRHRGVFRFVPTRGLPAGERP